MRRSDCPASVATVLPRRAMLRLVTRACVGAPSLGLLGALAPTPTQAAAATSAQAVNLMAREASMQRAVQALTQGRPIGAGAMRFDVPELVENGGTVPVTIEVLPAPGQVGAVTRMALFNERNPMATMAIFELGPACAKPQVSLRVRLATSQTLVALAQWADGSWTGAQTEVIVTLAACVEEMPEAPTR
jgi:sulfur-oxidizing protein SoxY